MKLLLLIMLTTFSFAGTQYKTPVFVVENSTLYCLKHKKYKDYEIVKYNPGDLVSGDYASNYCSYNFESVNDKIDERIKEEKNKEDKDGLGIGFILFIIIFISLIFVCLPNDNDEKK